MIYFIYGNPGTGKTEVIFKRLEEDAANGKNAILIVPEQMTVTLERDSLRRLPPSAQLHIEVLNFTRLANKLFRIYGGITYNYATPAIQKLLMWQAVKTAGPFLTEYQISRNDDRALAESMLAIYKEFTASGITFESVEKFSESMPDSVLSNKLKDIATVCAIYSNLLNERFSDENNELYRLSKLLEEENCFADTNVYIDGFSSLTNLEHSIIKSIFRQADNCFITIGIPYPGFKGIDTVSLKRFSEILRHDCASLGITSKTIELTENHRTNSDALMILSTDLWKLDSVLPQEANIEANQTIEVYRAADIYDECEFASAKIKKLIESGYRYRDISIIARDAEKYRGIIDLALENFDIPYFISDKTDLSLSPLSRLVLSALRIAAYGWQRSDVITHLKTGLCGISTHDADIFEAYTAKWKISGKKFLTESDWNMNPEGYSINKTERGEKILAIANKVKNSFIVKLKLYVAELKSATSYKDLSIATLNYLDKLDVCSSLRIIALRYIDMGKVREASEFVRIYDIFIDALDSICEAMNPDEQPDIITFSTAVRTVLENTELGSIPTSQDEVMIGSANMMRADNAKCVVLLGACDGDFPANVQSSGLLTDTERDYLINHNIAISGDREFRASDELYYFRRAASAPSQHLIVFTRADSEPSIALSRITALFPDIVIKETSEDLYTKLSSYKALSEYYPLFEGTSTGKAIEILLKNSTDEYHAHTGDGISAVSDVIDPQVVNMAIGKQLRISQSKIEEFIKCKFAYSCKYYLKLDDGKIAEFAYNNIGTFVHAILEKFLFYVFVSNKGIYPEGKEKNAAIDNIISSYLSELLLDEHEKSNARLFHLIDRLKTLSVLLIDDLLNEFSDSSFVPRYFELPIGTKEFPSIAVSLNNGTELTLNGIIDRVDIYKDGDNVYLRVVDYKTGDKTFSLSDIAEGKNLQLLLYIFSLTSNKRIREKSNEKIMPAGITYLSAVPSKVKAKGFQDSANTKKSAIAEIKRSGLVIDDKKVLNALSHSSQSRYLMSSPRKRSTVSEEEFNKLFNQVNEVLVSIGNEILSGNANAVPKEGGDACKYCSYASICRAAEKNDK